ncbi:MAG: LysR substrate-binding domain-containing protein [Bacteroidia bacterium]|nr:LysR substrate-binding domain-containing protein [Bacteroidia bacterium]
MTLQQLNYIIAVDNERHFARAAEACHVTQPTLSMMIQKLEEELDLQIFDRSKQPVMPTSEGLQLIEQARIILQEVGKFKDIGASAKNIISGELRVGIIPTLASYLMPLFISDFLEKYPLVKLIVEEINTQNIIESLKRGNLDVGILATPLNESSILEQPLFYEEFYLYTPQAQKKNYIVPEDINPNDLLLLEEGHCLRGQVINLCELRRAEDKQLVYQSGSLETLIHLVDSQQGITILPELAAFRLDKERQKQLTRFQKPSPVREISLVKHRNFVKSRLIEVLGEEILGHLPKALKRKKEMLVVEL